MVRQAHHQQTLRDFAAVLPTRGGVDNQSSPRYHFITLPAVRSASAARTSGVCFCPYDYASTPCAVHRLSERLQACPQRFLSQPQSGRDGHLKPMDLGLLIASRGGPGGASYALSEVRIYSGRPDPNIDMPTFSAHRRQNQAWELSRATVIERELRYLQGRPQEKRVSMSPWPSIS